MCRISKFRIIDFGLADFSEYYPQGRVDVGGPTHALPKKGPLHISLGKFDMLLPLPMSMQQMKALPRVRIGQNAMSYCLLTLKQHGCPFFDVECSDTCVCKSTRIYMISSNTAGVDTCKASQSGVTAQVSALERFYRFFWRNKGDVYHVLWDLTRCSARLPCHLQCMLLCWTSSAHCL
jgi:hypothetical protein